MAEAPSLTLDCQRLDGDALRPGGPVATASAPVDAVVRAAVAGGNAVSEVSAGWSKAREVVQMRDPMDAALRERVRSEGLLRHWTFEGSPHDRPEEGFMDDAERVAVAFPWPGG